MPEKTAQRLADHIRTSEKDVYDIKSDIKNIKENHLFHIERDVAQIKTKLEMLTKFFWLQMGVMVTGLGGMFFALIKLL